MYTDSMLAALQAPGPHPDLAKDLMLFGQFVGAWEVDVTNYAPDGTRQAFKGEWHFSCQNLAPNPHSLTLQRTAASNFVKADQCQSILRLRSLWQGFLSQPA